MGNLLSICEKCKERFCYPDNKDTWYKSNTWYTCKAGHYIGEVTVKPGKDSCRDFKQATDLEQIKLRLMLKDAEISSHGTDLYIQHTPERLAYCKENHMNVTCFNGSDDSGRWIELPFFLIDDKINKRKSKTC